MTTGWFKGMQESSRRLDKGLPKEETQRMSELGWDQRWGRVGEASMCRGRGEHVTFKERKEVQYN